MTYDRENRLDLRVRQLEATVRKQEETILDLVAAAADLTARLATAIEVAIILEGEIDECPEDGFHDSYAYRGVDE